MKVKPVLDALARSGHDVVLVHTGQHYDAGMSDVFFDDLGLRSPDYHLGVGSGSHATQTSKVMLAFEPIVLSERPDVVVVVGDVNSTLACALVAAKCGVMLGHVEAGLRSGDWTMPEEINRVVTDRVSDILFAPSEDAVQNLRAEGRQDEQIRLVGNVMVDTLLANIDRARDGGTLARLGLAPGEYGLVTLHRPANVDDPIACQRLLAALEQVAAMCPLVLPAHPRLAERLGYLHGASPGGRPPGTPRGASPGGRPPGTPRGATRITILPPAGYLDFIALEAAALIVLTDSGGVQEETTALGIPCLTLRDTTERPITVTHGTNQVVGTDPARIVQAARAVLAEPPVPRRPSLWDGRAGERVAAELIAWPGHAAASAAAAAHAIR